MAEGTGVSDELLLSAMITSYYLVFHEIATEIKLIFDG
jgi:hypothetical protein